MTIFGVLWPTPAMDKQGETMCNPSAEIKNLSDVPMSPSVVLGDVPSDGHEWMLFIDGRRVRFPFSRVDLVLTKGRGEQAIYRHVQLGLMGSEGNEYEAIAYCESGGGGTAVLPFAFIDGRLYIGVVLQHRQLMGLEPVYTAAGGYQAPTDASARDTGERELREEVTNNTQVIRRTFMLGGGPVNPNRAVFVTAGEGEGVKYYAVEVFPLYLVPSKDGHYHFVRGVEQTDPSVEKALGTVFVPVREAALCKCGLVRAGLTALLVDLGII